jgi:hypothetical protein
MSIPVNNRITLDPFVRGILKPSSPTLAIYLMDLWTKKLILARHEAS